jgi:hypothetical protein
MLSLAHRQYLRTFNNETEMVYGNVSTQLASLFSSQTWTLNNPSENDTRAAWVKYWNFSFTWLALTNLWIILGIVSQVVVVFRMIRYQARATVRHTILRNNIAN